MNDNTSGFANLMPGFDFLQGLVKNAGASLPGVGQWVAPTLDPAELEKRIEELRTVQFWLEQNARVLATTIQALEVQRMTLSTLKTMNVQMTDLQQALSIKPNAAPAQPAARPAPAPPAAAAPAAPEAAKEAPTQAAADAPPAVDPMQWWGALTKQFSELAASAIQDGSGKGLAAAMGKRSIDGVADGKPAKKTAAAKRSTKAGTTRKGGKDAAKAAKPS